MAFLNKAGLTEVLSKLWAQITNKMTETVDEAISNIDIQDEIYIGADELPEGYTLQINPDGDVVALASVPFPATEDIGKFLRVSDVGTYALNEIVMAEEVSL